MMDKNSLPFGVAIALIVPLVVFAFLYGLFELLEMLNLVSDAGFSPMFRERTTSIVAIAANAILLNLFQKKRLMNTMRGIVISTSVLVAIWVILFGEHIFWI